MGERTPQPGAAMSRASHPLALGIHAGVRHHLASTPPDANRRRGRGSCIARGGELALPQAAVVLSSPGLPYSAALLCPAQGRRAVRLGNLTPTLKVAVSSV